MLARSRGTILVPAAAAVNTNAVIWVWSSPKGRKVNNLAEVKVKRKVGRPKGVVPQTSLDRYASFVAAYLSCFSFAEAARRIGITENENRRGYELYHNPRVHNLIKRGMRSLLKKAHVDARDMILKLQRNEQMAFDANDLKESTRCLELMGKTIALFKEKSEVEVSVVPLGPRQIILNPYTPEGKKCLTTDGDNSSCPADKA